MKARFLLRHRAQPLVQKYLRLRYCHVEASTLFPDSQHSGVFCARYLFRICIPSEMWGSRARGCSVFSSVFRPSRTLPRGGASIINVFLCVSVLAARYLCPAREHRSLSPSLPPFQGQVRLLIHTAVCSERRPSSLFLFVFVPPHSYAAGCAAAVAVFSLRSSLPALSLPLFLFTLSLFPALFCLFISSPKRARARAHVHDASVSVSVSFSLKCGGK